MLAEMTPEEFEERWAHWLVEPWGKEMEVASAVGAMILNAIRMAVSTEKVPEDELYPLDFFLPKQASEGAQRQEFDSGNFTSVMRRVAGV